VFAANEALHQPRVTAMPPIDLATVLVLWIIGAVLIFPLAGLAAHPRRPIHHLQE
jgi:hypothetical protein